MPEDEWEGGVCGSEVMEQADARGGVAGRGRRRGCGGGC